MKDNVLVTDFLNSLSAEKGASKNTISAYNNDLSQMIDFLGDDFDNIKQNDLQKFVAYLQNNDYSATSICRKISTMKDFFKFLFSEKEIVGKVEIVVPQDRAVRQQAALAQIQLPDVGDGFVCHVNDVLNFIVCF